MEERKTVEDWAKMDGMIGNSARYIRERIGVGEYVGRVWLLTQSEWNKVKATHTGPRQRPVQQSSEDGVEIEVFPSLAAAQRKTAVGYTNISSACRGKTHTAGGFRWGYVEGKS